MQKITSTANDMETENARRLNGALKRLESTTQADLDLRQSAPRPEVIEALQSDRLAAIDVLEQACSIYADRPALGERAFVLEETPAGRIVRHLPVFRTITYRSVWERTVQWATGLVREPRTALRPGERVGIFGFGSLDYVLADMACLYAGCPSAVLQMSMGPEDLRHVMTEGDYACVFSSLEGLPALFAVLPGCSSVRSVVVMDFHSEAAPEAEAWERLRARAAVPLITVQELAALGRDAAPLAPFVPAPGTDPLATLMYTSGSTGFPKGAMLTQSLWRSHWRLLSLTELTRFPHIGINFYPLSHAMGRHAVLRALVLGGVTHFTLKSDMSTLFEDIRLVRPTFLNLVPRIAEMIHQAYRTDLLGGIQAGLAPAAAQAKAVEAMRRTFLGDRLVAAVIGSAPTAPEVLAFLAQCFEIPVYEGFGSTEAGILTIDGRINRAAVSAFRLVDVPDLGYRLSDQPYPRGELQVKTCQCIPGYDRNPEATRNLYETDGFQKTGDIVEQRGPDQVAWIDRKNNVVKLAQGEYVTLWRLESTFSAGSVYLDQVYLQADQRRTCLLGVLVPDWRALNERLARQGQASTPAAVKQLLRLELNRIAGEARLRPFEVPRDFLVESARWTRENGLLTGVNKPARPQLKRQYGDRLEALYGQLEAQREQDFAALGGAGDQAPLAVRARQAVQAVLGVPDLDLGSGSFHDLGGDSIAALTLATLLEELCGAPVPVAAILNPGCTLQTLVDQLLARSDRPGALPGFGAIHGREPLIRAEDLRLDRFLDPAELAEAAMVATQPLAPARTVLLTGASGFLGHILCLQWLEQVAKDGGRVFAIVRAGDDRAAADRLRAAFRGDPGLERAFTDLAGGGRLVVLAGDLAAPGLGLAAAVHERLAAEVDLIVHAGALVNHVYGYEQLFTPNVVGTAQLLRLALHGRRKRFDYVSTIGVLAGARTTSGRVLERDGVDALPTVWPLDGGYAHGYAVSKWACEVLLKELHERFATPVRVFRPAMILPHRRGRGQANAPDMLSRLLASVVATGLAPRSFYVGGQGAKAHYDGLPVDFIAAALVALSSAQRDDYVTYQVSNAHWEDGVSLDTLMGWVQSAGYRLERMNDYAAWFAAFRDKLQALPAAERQRSALAILPSWARPSAVRNEARADAAQFVRDVRRQRPGGEAELPHLSEAFLHKYLADLQVLGLIQPPEPGALCAPGPKAAAR